MSEYTPGPWEAVPNGTAYVKSAEMVLCRIDQIGDIPDNLAVALVIADCSLLRETGQAEANARLIAAAPDLLAACRAALAELKAVEYPDDVDRTWGASLASLEAAIAKAEGSANS